jgi:hypothetical protein
VTPTLKVNSSALNDPPVPATLPSVAKVADNATQSDQLMLFIVELSELLLDAVGPSSTVRMTAI